MTEFALAHPYLTAFVLFVVVIEVCALIDSYIDS